MRHCLEAGTLKSGTMSSDAYLWSLKLSKYPMRAKLAGGEDATISVPQLDIHPLLPGSAVPGAPVADKLGVQNSDVIPLK